MESNGELVAQQFGGLSAEHGSPVGIQFGQGELPFDEWKDRVASLAKIRTFSPFAVADVFNYGVQHYGEKKAMSDTLIKLADHNEKYIRKCADIGRIVPYNVRKLGMSFEHHSAVSKVTSPGCDDHKDFPIKNAAECPPCEDARLRSMSEWLDRAGKKGWSAKELKDQIRGSTTVREHQRNLDGRDFDPDAFKEALEDVKTNFKIVTEALKFGALVTKANNLDKSKNKALLEKLKDLKESIGNMEEVIGKYL